MQAEERILLDTEAYYQARKLPRPMLNDPPPSDHVPEPSFCGYDIESGEPQPKVEQPESHTPTKQECLLAPSTIKGFALQSKKWGEC